MINENVFLLRETQISPISSSLNAGLFPSRYSLTDRSVSLEPDKSSGRRKFHQFVLLLQGCSPLQLQENQMNILVTQLVIFVCYNKQHFPLTTFPRTLAILSPRQCQLWLTSRLYSSYHISYISACQLHGIFKKIS